MAVERQQEKTFIDTPGKLEDYCRSLEGAERIAIDTEFVGEKYFYPRLELIQVSDGNQIGLIDAQACGSLDPLARVLGNPEVLKIFHAADSDIPILKRALGVDLSTVFDTQVAASLLGYGAQVSLSNLIRALLGIQVSSKQSTSDWSQRPLTKDQLDYAANDVLHLHELEDVLRADLLSEDRLAWYHDEQQARLDGLSRQVATPDDELYRRVKDWVSLTPREMAILRELAKWREDTARTENIPRRSVFTDEGLVEFSRFAPATKADARKLRRVHQGQVGRYFETVSKIVERASKIPKDQWPEKPTGERPDIPTGLLELCQALVRTEGERRRIAPTVLATSAELQRIVNRRKNLLDEDHPVLQGWRREVVGLRLESLLLGKVAVRVSDSGDLIFEDV